MIRMTTQRWVLGVVGADHWVRAGSIGGGGCWSHDGCWVLLPRVEVIRECQVVVRAGWHADVVRHTFFLRWPAG